MISIENIHGVLQAIYNISYQFVQAVVAGTSSIIDINYQVISTVLTVTSEVANKVANILRAFFFVSSVLLQASFEFVSECWNFVWAFLHLIWKFLLLLMSVVNLAICGLEQLFQFIMSGGSRTAGALKVALFNVQDVFLVATTHGEVLFKKCFTSVTGGLVVLGTLTYKLLAHILSFTKYIILTTCLWIDKAMIAFAESVKFISDTVYYFITDNIIYARKEIYLGVIMLLLMYLLVTKTSQVLHSQGMTFPFPMDFGQGQPARRRRRFRPHQNEFSDEEGTSDIDFSENESSISDDDDDDDDDNDSDGNPISQNNDEDSDETDSEYSVIDDDDDEEDDRSSTYSNATTTEIDIQLPNARDPHYNLRRSTTPSRRSCTSPEDFEKEIEKERERQMCVVCHDNLKSVLILPCRHMCLCVDCANTIVRARAVNRRVCPLCRQNIRTIMNVYV